MSDKLLIAGTMLKMRLKKKYVKSIGEGHAGFKYRLIYHTECHLCEWKKPGVNRKALKPHLRMKHQL